MIDPFTTLAALNTAVNLVKSTVTCASRPPVTNPATGNAWQTTVKVLTTGVLAALLVGVAIKLRLMGGPQ